MIGFLAFFGLCCLVGFMGWFIYTIVRWIIEAVSNSTSSGYTSYSSYKPSSTSSYPNGSLRGKDYGIHKAYVDSDTGKTRVWAVPVGSSEGKYVDEDDLVNGDPPY